MHHHYKDILELTDREPLWFDENGVPRYCEFSYNQVSNIYASEVALLLISCQACERQFRVAMSNDYISTIMNETTSLKERIESHVIHYGDPPNVECCPGGPSMNCNDLQVLEFWMRIHDSMIRVQELEIILPDHQDWDETHAG